MHAVIEEEDSSGATLEDGKAQFQKSWDAWKRGAKLEEVPCVR
jgi:hypothetical protein